MIKQAKAGKPVDLSEMPPPVSVSVTPAPAPVPSEPPSAETPLIDLGSGSAERKEPKHTEDKPKGRHVQKKSVQWYDYQWLNKDQLG